MTNRADVLLDGGLHVVAHAEREADFRRDEERTDEQAHEVIDERGCPAPGEPIACWRHVAGVSAKVDDAAYAHRRDARDRA